MYFNIAMHRWIQLIGLQMYARNLTANLAYIPVPFCANLMACHALLTWSSTTLWIRWTDNMKRFKIK